MDEIIKHITLFCAMNMISNSKEVNNKLQIIIKLLIAITVSLSVVYCIYFFYKNKFDYACSITNEKIYEEKKKLKGIYTYINKPGRRNSHSYIDDTEIYCNGFSYYWGTFLSHSTHRDCNDLIENFIGKYIEVEIVDIPKENHENKRYLVSKISADGKVIVSRSDSFIRSEWKRETYRDINASCVTLFTILTGFSVYFIDFFSKNAKSIAS